MTSSNELRQAIDTAYAVFAEIKWRGRNATVCPCCVSEANARDLARISRRDLSAALISEYLGSAHHHSEGSAADEAKHFLPRIFELLATGAEVSMSGNECALIRLGRGPLGWDDKTYRDLWTREEIAAVERCLQALWRATLAETPSLFRRDRDGLWLFQENRAEEFLCMVAHAGDDVAPYLAMWEADDSVSASLHMAALVSEAMIREWRPFALLEEGKLGDPHWERQQSSMCRIVDWLVDPRRRDRLFLAALAAVADSPQAIVLAEAHYEIERILAARAARR